MQIIAKQQLMHMPLQMTHQENMLTDQPHVFNWHLSVWVHLLSGPKVFPDEQCWWIISITSICCWLV